MSRTSAPLRARYIGYTKGTENHGDEALLWIIRDLLAPEIIVVTDTSQYDLALLGGGTLINQSPWLIDFFASALDRTGRGVAIGTGVGDLTFWGNHFARWTPLLNRCRFVGVRGPDSLSLLREHGVANAQCVGDPYLWLQSPVEAKPIAKRLGVNIGSTNNALWGTNDSDLAQFVAEVLARLKSSGWTFAWTYVWEKDRELVEGLRTKLGAESGPIFDARAQTLETYSALAQCDLFLGEKLHANAMAAVAGVPFVSIEYQPKVRDFAASLGMEDWIVSSAERDPSVVVREIEQLRIDRKLVRRKLVEARKALRRRLLEFIREIKVHYGLLPQKRARRSVRSVVL